LASGVLDCAMLAARPAPAARIKPVVVIAMENRDINFNDGGSRR